MGIKSSTQAKTKPSFTDDFWKKVRWVYEQEPVFTLKEALEKVATSEGISTELQPKISAVKSRSSREKWAKKPLKSKSVPSSSLGRIKQEDRIALAQLATQKRKNASPVATSVAGFASDDVDDDALSEGELRKIHDPDAVREALIRTHKGELSSMRSLCNDILQAVSDSLEASGSKETLTTRARAVASIVPQILALQDAESKRWGLDDVKQAGEPYDAEKARQEQSALHERLNQQREQYKGRTFDDAALDSIQLDEDLTQQEQDYLNSQDDHDDLEDESYVSPEKA
ncbi:MAG: hypothetical protein VXW65_01365 [Pseudomonadota bacterium]|nr:hypothetical protein [Pseudomonadota bacterium]